MITRIKEHKEGEEPVTTFDFYTGEHKNGVKHGEGELTDEDGTTVRGIWQDGTLVTVISKNDEPYEGNVEDVWNNNE